MSHPLSGSSIHHPYAWSHFSWLFLNCFFWQGKFFHCFILCLPDCQSSGTDVLVPIYCEPQTKHRACSVRVQERLLQTASFSAVNHVKEVTISKTAFLVKWVFHWDCLKVTLQHIRCDVIVKNVQKGKLWIRNALCSSQCVRTPLDNERNERQWIVGHSGQLLPFQCL